MNMNIGTKLVICTAAVVGLAGVVGFSGLKALDVIKAQFDNTADKTVRKIELADEITSAAAEMVAAQRGGILAVFGKDAVEFAADERDFHERVNLVRSATAEIEPMLVTAEGKALVTEMRRSLDGWQQKYGEMVIQCQKGDIASANRVRKEEIVPFTNKLTNSARRLAALQREIMGRDRAALDALDKRSWWIISSVLGLAVCVGLVVFAVVRSVTRGLRNAVSDLSLGAEQVASAAAQISVASQSLAQGSSEQAASLEETSASGEEISSMANRNCENSRSAATLVQQSQSRFDEANQSLGLMVAAMEEINAQSAKISKIIKVIDEIAFQTNILALNAAVEAARAGESGMGFAVVADEVRNLAQRCAQAARDTSGLIEESIVKSGEGKNRVTHVAAAIRSVVDDAGKVKALVDDVNSGSTEQARGIQQVAAALAQMDQVTQQTAASAEECASSAEELSAQSEALHDIVRQLTGMVGAARATEAAPPPQRQRTAKALPAGRASAEANAFASF